MFFVLDVVPVVVKRLSLFGFQSSPLCRCCDSTDELVVSRTAHVSAGALPGVATMKQATYSSA